MIFVNLLKKDKAMSQLIIEVDTPEDEALLLRLLPKLSARVVSRSIPKPESNESVIDIMNRIAERGGVGESFGDASEWQREIRSWDRVLDGREE